MQEVVKRHMLGFDRRVVDCVELPRVLVLYAVDADHFVLSVKPLESLEETALTKSRVSVVVKDDKYLVNLPSKVYNFYKLDESDYTVLSSSKDPVTIIVSV